MIQEKARKIYELLKQGKGLTSVFGENYYDDETRKIIEVITNECKSTYTSKTKQKRVHESEIDIKTVRAIVEQLLSDKSEIKNTIVAELTSQNGIRGITKPIKIEKKVSEKGLLYLDIEEPFPENFTEILTGNPNREELMEKVIKPYAARVARKDPQLSKKHLFSRIFSPLNRKEISDNELLERYSKYLKENTDLSDEKIETMSKYFIYNILGNKELTKSLIEDEIQGKSLEVLGESKKKGYSGMIASLSNNLIDILSVYKNPNDRLQEINDIYANATGNLQALGTEIAKEPQQIEEQIIKLNRSMNRENQDLYEQNGYRNVNVGISQKDVGFVNFQNVPQAMKLYAEKCKELADNADNMSKEEYIRQVAKMHFRFIHIHPFPDGNGRTARALTNMFLSKKGECAKFDKESKREYSRLVGWLDSRDVQLYKQALSSNPDICDEIENKMIYKLEEYIGIEVLGEKDLYKNRDITEKLPDQKEQSEQER